MRYFNSSPEVICRTAMMYIRDPLSLRQVDDLLLKRSTDICHETVWLWWYRFGSIDASIHNHFNLNRHLNNRETFEQNRLVTLTEWCQLAA